MTNQQANRRALVLLATGGMVGILLGVAAAVHNERGSDVGTLPHAAIALVNGRLIREEEYTRAVAMLASDKRTAITDEDRVHVLNRLIEEELLVQRGIENGLVDSDRAVRKAITQAMLASIVAESASAQPSEDDLRAFYEKNPSLFTRSAPTANGQGAAGGKVMEPPAFEDVREQVEVAYLRRSRDDALREYLQWLRAEAKIVLAPEAHQ
jgi:hypothetical protein